MAELTAVIWDFDGTLVDTREKNLNVTRALVELVTGLPAERFSALRSLVDYERALQRHGSWKDFYCEELRMTDAQANKAGSRWMEYQLRDRTPVPPFDGIEEVLQALQHLPHGIVSLNAKPNIERFLGELELHHHFEEVLGYEAVAMDRQKPKPDALLLCIERMTGMRPGRVLFVGDHEVDVQCAHNATRLLASRGVPIEVLSVGAHYSPNAESSHRRARPHFTARCPREILDYVEELRASLV